MQKIDSGHPYAYAVTDASGKFSIDNPGATLRIQDWKHRPSRVVLTPQTHNVEFATEPSETDAVKLPVCANSRLTKRAQKRNAGEFWYFLVPRNAKVVRESDTDYVVYSLYFRDSKEHLWFASGPLYGGYQAPAEWLVEAQDFTERAILEPQGTMAGVDVFGSSKSGERFRSFGLGTDYISYRTGVPEAAAFFDAFIATACTPPLGPK